MSGVCYYKARYRDNPNRNVNFLQNTSLKSYYKEVGFLCITKYDSTLYIGMDEVLAHYACTF